MIQVGEFKFYVESNAGSTTKMATIRKDIQSACSFYLDEKEVYQLEFIVQDIKRQMGLS